MKFPRINKGPEIKLPKLSLRKRSRDDGAHPEAEAEAPAEARPKASSRRGPSLPQPPAFVQDIYRDLRDRRLLLPAAALLVGIVAVPVLMKASPEPAPAIPPKAVPEDAAAVAPAVLAEQEVGVRDYRKRLAELKRKNPFDAKLQYSASEIAEQTAISEPPDPTASTGTGDGRDGGGSPDIQVVDDLPQPQPPGGGGDRKPGVELMEPRIDVRFGPVGELSDYESLKPMKPLPGKRNMILIFGGFAEKADEVVFMVADEVVRTKGDGRCTPRAKNCQFLVLREGEARTFDFRHRNGTVTKYRLKLRTIRLEVTRDPDFERSLER